MLTEETELKLKRALIALYHLPTHWTDMAVWDAKRETLGYVLKRRTDAWDRYEYEWGIEFECYHQRNRLRLIECVLSERFLSDVAYSEDEYDELLHRTEEEWQQAVAIVESMLAPAATVVGPEDEIDTSAFVGSPDWLASFPVATSIIVVRGNLPESGDVGPFMVSISAEGFEDADTDEAMG